MLCSAACRVVVVHVHVLALGRGRRRHSAGHTLFAPVVEAEVCAEDHLVSEKMNLQANGDIKF